MRFQLTWSFGQNRRIYLKLKAAVQLPFCSSDPAVRRILNVLKTDVKLNSTIIFKAGHRRTGFYFENLGSFPVLPRASGSEFTGIRPHGEMEEENEDLGESESV